MSSQTRDNSGSEDAIVAVRMPAVLRDRLKLVAGRNNRTVSGELRQIAQEHVDAELEAEAA